MATPTEQVGCLSSLDDHEAFQILTISDARMRMTSRDNVLARVSMLPSLWAFYVKQCFELGNKPVGPRGEPCGDDWFRLFTLWRDATKFLGLGDVASSVISPMPPARWISLWFRMRKWLELLPEVASTLRSLVRSRQTSEFEAVARDHELDLGTPTQAVLGMWQVFDGQQNALQNDVAKHIGLNPSEIATPWTHGIFGGFSVYEHRPSTFLLPFLVAVKLTKFLRSKVPQLAEQESQTKLVFACSSSLKKILLVDVHTGGVYAFTFGHGDRILESIVPSSSDYLDEFDTVRLHGLKAKPELNGTQGVLIKFDSSKGRWQVRMEDGSNVVHLLKPENLTSLSTEHTWPDEPSDGLARWFEIYVRRLEDGVYGRMALVAEQGSASQGINLFPISGPKLFRCVTHGVEVTAASIYMPEQEKGWTYSITFQLLGNPSEWGFETCQLQMRTWIIQEEGQNAQNVKGEGVIGFFPILKEGGWLLNSESDPHHQYALEHGFIPGPFRYQSASGRMRSGRGSFGGHISFFPGTVKRPTGAPFEVQVPTFQLRVPKYNY